MFENVGKYIEEATPASIGRDLDQALGSAGSMVVEGIAILGVGAIMVWGIYRIARFVLKSAAETAYRDKEDRHA